MGGRQVDSIRKVSDPFEEAEGQERNSTRLPGCAVRAHKIWWVSGQEATKQQQQPQPTATATVTATVAARAAAAAATVTVTAAVRSNSRRDCCHAGSVNRHNL